MVNKNEIDSTRPEERTLILLEASIGVCVNISDNNSENAEGARNYA